MQAPSGTYTGKIVTKQYKVMPADCPNTPANATASKPVSFDYVGMTVPSGWRTVTLPASIVGIGVSGNGSVFIAVAATGAVYLSSTYGVNWQTVHTIPTPLSIQKPAISFDGKYIAITNVGGELWRSADYGATWAAVTLPTSNIPLNPFRMSSDGSKWFGYNSAGLVYSSTSGATWSTLAGSISGAVGLSGDGSIQVWNENNGLANVFDFWSNFVAQGTYMNFIIPCLYGGMTLNVTGSVLVTTGGTDTGKFLVLTGGYAGSHAMKNVPLGYSMMRDVVTPLSGAVTTLVGIAFGPVNSSQVMSSADYGTTWVPDLNSGSDFKMVSASDDIQSIIACHSVANLSDVRIYTP